MEIAFQQSLFGKTSSELGYLETGWIISPYCERSRAPKFQCLLLDSGQMPEWCEGDDVISPGAFWTPNIGQTLELHAGKESFSWQILQANVPEKYYLSPAHCSRIPDLRNAGGVSAAEANRGNFIEAGRRIPVVQPFFRTANARRRKAPRSADVSPKLWKTDRSISHSSSIRTISFCLLV